MQQSPVISKIRADRRSLSRPIAQRKCARRLSVSKPLTASHQHSLSQRYVQFDCRAILHRPYRWALAGARAQRTDERQNLEMPTSAHVLLRSCPGGFTFMLTPYTTKTLRHATLGAELVPYQPASPSLASIKRPAHGLKSRYWLRSLLLSGIQGVVYQAKDLILNRPCSVKLIESSLNGKKNLEQRFLREAETLSRLSHPNIVKAYEFTRDELGNPFIVMEPLDGRDLRSLLAEVPVLPLEQALEILRAVGAALQHAHDLGIVHQDINPSSIFLNKETSATGRAVEVVKVINFGLAKQLTPDGSDQERNLHLGLVFGSPTYLAPEELELSSERVDGRSDQWSLAVLAYQLLSGQLPFWEIDPWCLRELIRGAVAPVPLAQLRPELPPYVLAAVQKALSKDKNQRYSNVADFIAALDGAPAFASKQTKPELRIDLIEQCRPAGNLLAGVESPLVSETQTQTREYPALSFPAELLASADEEPKFELDALVTPELMPLPLWSADQGSQRQRGTVRRLWLLGCVVITLASAPVIAALHYLHPGPSPTARIYPSPALPAQSPPLFVLPSLPSVLATLPVAPPAAALAPPMAHKSKPAQSHLKHPRASREADPDSLLDSACQDKTSRKQTQANLAEGLGL